MRSTLAAAVVLASCLTALGAPAALAQDDDSTTTGSTPTSTSEQPAATHEPDPAAEPDPDQGIEPFLALTPSSAAPGETVRVQVACDDAATSFLESPALYLVELTSDPDGHMPWALFGTTTVPEWVEPGSYPVFSECGTEPLRATFTVLPTGDDGDDGDRNQVSRTPKGAPETGGGADDEPLGVLLTGLAGLAGVGALAARRAVRR